MYRNKTYRLIYSAVFSGIYILAFPQTWSSYCVKNFQDEVFSNLQKENKDQKKKTIKEKNTEIFFDHLSLVIPRISLVGNNSFKEKTWYKYKSLVGIFTRFTRSYVLWQTTVSVQCGTKIKRVYFEEHPWHWHHLSSTVNLYKLKNLQKLCGFGHIYWRNP